MTLDLRNTWDFIHLSQSQLPRKDGAGDFRGSGLFPMRRRKIPPGRASAKRRWKISSLVFWQGAPLLFTILISKTIQNLSWQLSHASMFKQRVEAHVDCSDMCVFWVHLVNVTSKKSMSWTMHNTCLLHWRHCIYRVTMIYRYLWTFWKILPLEGFHPWKTWSLRHHSRGFRTWKREKT